MGKTLDERLWLLRRYDGYGWTRDALSAKKWDAHRSTLLRLGYLEPMPDGKLYRITDAGRAALAES